MSDYFLVVFKNEYEDKNRYREKGNILTVAFALFMLKQKSESQPQMKILGMSSKVVIRITSIFLLVSFACIALLAIAAFF